MSRQDYAIPPTVSSMPHHRNKERNMITRIEDTRKVAALFEGWQETMIWSCLQKVMGSIYADDRESPTAAMAVLGDFYCFAGEPDLELVSYNPDACARKFIIMVPQSIEWAKLIEKRYSTTARKIIRNAMKKEPQVFDTDRLRNIVTTLPPEYSLRMIDGELYHRCKAENWSSDLVSQYADYATYERLGLGVAALRDGRIVSGASSYSTYLGGIEIEIDTKEAYRRKGLASVCGAKLILECLDRNLYPSWDAHDKVSVALAEKLGYHFDHEYVAYEICER